MKIFSPILKGTTTVAQGTTNLSGSFTGSLFGTAATASYADNFTVGGTLTAQTINVQIITSSIEFNTGSTRNGALSTNTHQFTGSVLMSGSLGIGVNSPVTALEILPSISNSSIKTGGIEIQSYAVNNGWIADNMYYSGSWKARATGYSTNLNFGAGTINFTRAASTGSGATIFPTSSMFIDASGNVGIGTSSPSGGISGNELALHLSHSNVSILALQSTAASGKKWQIYSSNDGGLYFRDGTAGTQVVSFSSNGSVGIGTTSPDTNLTVYGANVSTANASANANVYTTTGYGVDVGGSIGLGGYYNATNNITYANLHGKKENATLNDSNGYFAVSVRNASAGTVERMRITSAGNCYLGDGFANTNHRINKKVAQGSTILVVSAYDTVLNDTAVFSSCNGASGNGAATAMMITKNDSTNRSINAGGTINASGADYAEYMTKSVNDTINKGDIVGVDINGKLTNIFADSISFVIKSTDPSYVGGDVWGNEEAIGKKPLKTTNQTEEEFAIINEAFEIKLEEARVKVDRISFSGQVPCNVLGANVGDYIIPIQTEEGKITGQAVSSPSFEQYQISVGKVWKIMEDGRAWIAVKIG
jgi:hypothetical protein